MRYSNILPYAWRIAIQLDFHSNETRCYNIALLSSGILLRDRRTDLIILLLVRIGSLALAIRVFHKLYGNANCGIFVIYFVKIKKSSDKMLPLVGIDARP